MYTIPKIFSAFCLLLISSLNMFAQQSVPYKLATNYYLRNDYTVIGKFGVFDSKAKFDIAFGKATTMGAKGQPTAIDFNKDFVIAIIESPSQNAAAISIQSVSKENDKLTINYTVNNGAKQNYTSNVYAILILDKKFKGQVVLKKNPPKSGGQYMRVTPSNVEGNLGLLTFTQNEQTMFYFDYKANKGAIVIDGKEYKLTSSKLNNPSSKTETYILSGSGVTITAANVKAKPNEGSDCFYGSAPLVTITLAGNSTKLENLNYQDCPTND